MRQFTKKEKCNFPHKPGSKNALVEAAAAGGSWNAVANGARLLSNETTLCCSLCRERHKSSSWVPDVWPSFVRLAVGLDL